MRQSLGIYIHIPFCASKCSYCDFYSLAGCDYLMDDYQDALLEHLDESAHSIQNYEVDTVYFGGGTPSYYGADRLVQILDTMAELMAGCDIEDPASFVGLVSELF